MSVCRVCLTGGDVKLYSVIHARLREVYEKLSNSKFNSKDGRPRAVCCFCYQRLLRCCTFSAMAHRSEKVLDELLLKGLEATHETIEDLNLEMVQPLSASPMQSFKLGCETPKDNSLLAIKQETILAEVVRIEEKKLDTEPVMSLICEEHLNNQFDFEDIDEDMDLDLKAQNTSETVAVISCKELHEKLPKTVERAEPKHECNICKKIFNNLRSLQRHVKLHKEMNSYTCTLCSQQFKKSHQLLTHMIHHRGAQKYACVVCNRQCNNERNLKLHMKVHSVEKVLHTCDVCDQHCDNTWNLEKHMEIHKWYK